MQRSLPEPPHRRATLTALLSATVFGAVLFGALNITRGVYALAVVELVMGAYALALMVIVRRTPHLRRWTLLYLLPFFSAMLFALATPDASPTVFIWILLIPIIAHLLLGRWLGLAISVTFLLAAGGVYLYRFQGEPELFSVIAVANVIMCSLVILGMSHVAEATRERSDRRLLAQASTDNLTGLANRAHLKTVFQREQARATRQGTPLSLLLLDLDHFKRVNDQYGHEAGDTALIHVARLLRERLRSVDLACRHGGEEFAIILTGTDGRAAAEVAESLRRSLETNPLPWDGWAIRLTASIGVAELGSDGDALDRLLACADRRLFQAKAQGRNCVVTGAWPKQAAAQGRRSAADAGAA